MSLSDRLKEARRRKYRSARAAAEALGVPESTYYGHENGSRDPSRDDVARYARFFAVSPAWLEYGSTEPTSPEAIRRVIVAGETQAGMWREVDALIDEPPAPIPAIETRYGALPQFAYRVRGGSMMADRIFDGDYVICVPYFDARARITDGDIVVVERRRGGETETTVKRVATFPGRFELRPNSTDPRYREAIIVVRNHLADDGTEIEVKGLVVGVFSPRD